VTEGHVRRDRRLFRPPEQARRGLHLGRPDFHAWSATGAASGPISLIDYVGFIATLDSLFAFAALFFPDLVVHDGLRFLASGFSSTTYEAWLKEGRSGHDIQRVLNHLHICSLLQQQEVSDEAAVEAARIIAEIWTRTLGPEGLTVVTSGSTLSDAAVTFFETPSEE
jgi:hypothetical protein